MRDVDVKIRDSVSNIIKASLQTMENDVADGDIL